VALGELIFLGNGMRLAGDSSGLTKGSPLGIRDLVKNFLSILRAWKSGLLLAIYALARLSSSRAVVMFASPCRSTYRSVSHCVLLLYVFEQLYS